MQWCERFRGANQIYERLEDDESKSIFEKRCEYFVDRDEIKFWNDIKKGKTWRCPNQEEDFIIFGTGVMGGYYYDILLNAGKNVVGFCDNYKKGTFCGKNIWSVEEAIRKGNKIVVPYGTYTNEMLKQLQEMGIDNNRIVLEPDIRSYTGNQYFDVWEPREKEILVDCGAYDGDTIRDFIKWNNSNYETIYAFEPSIRNYEKCAQYLNENKIENCRLFNKGTWSQSATLKFSSYLFDTGDHVIGDSRDVNNSEMNVNEIKVVSIDEILKGNKATFIKMDVEGSELESLIGAKETITQYSPRLAVSIYHKLEDIFDIPLYILQQNNDYRFKIRHYSSGICETVLYAEVLV